MAKPALWFALPILGAFLFGIGFAFAAVLNLKSPVGWPASNAAFAGGWVALIVGAGLGLGTLETTGRRWGETMRATGRIHLSVSDTGMRWNLDDGSEGFVPWSAVSLLSRSAHALYVSRGRLGVLVLPNDLPEKMIATILARAEKRNS